MKSSFIAVALAFLTLVPPAFGGIISPTSVDTGGLGQWPHPLYVAENLFDQDGMSGPFSKNSTYSYSHGDGSYWHSATQLGTGNDTLRIDLGAIHNIGEFYLWQADHTHGSFRVGDFNLRFFGADGSTEIGSVAAFSATGANSGSPALSETFAFSSRSNVRFVDMTILSTLAAKPGFSENRNFVTIGEVAFGAATAAVPEPSSLTIFGMGALCLGGLSRRRGNNQVRSISK